VAPFSTADFYLQLKSFTLISRHCAARFTCLASAICREHCCL